GPLTRPSMSAPVIGTVTPARRRRRCLVVALSMLAPGAVAFCLVGLPALGPALQREFGLISVQRRAVFGAVFLSAVLAVTLGGFGSRSLSPPSLPLLVAHSPLRAIFIALAVICAVPALAIVVGPGPRPAKFYNHPSGASTSPFTDHRLRRMLLPSSLI